MAHPPIKIHLPFFGETKQWDLHELQLKRWGIVNIIGQGRGGTPEWCKSVILLTLTGQAQEMARELKEANLDEMLAVIRNAFQLENGQGIEITMMSENDKTSRAQEIGQPSSRHRPKGRKGLKRETNPSLSSDAFRGNITKAQFSKIC